MADQWMLDRIKQQKAEYAGGAKPTMAPAAAPVPQAKAPALQQKQVDPWASPQGKFMSGGILEKAMDIPRSIEYAVAGFQKGGMDEKRRQIASGEVDRQGYGELIGGRFMKGFEGIKKGIENRITFGSEKGNVDAAANLGIKNPYAKSAYNFGLSLAMPSLPVGGVLRGAAKTKIGQKVVENATNLGQKAINIARSTDSIAKVAEKVDPFFRTPELGKMVSEAGEKMQQRQTKVYQMVMDAAKGLTPAEQARVGQILEGGITTSADSKLAKIAAPLRELSDAVGKEAVEMGLLKPGQYEKYRGKYMSHIWKKMAEEDKAMGSSKGLIENIKGQFFKARKGKAGYIREFAPAVMRGIGTEVKDIEKAKLIKDIAKKYGVTADEGISAAEFVKNKKAAALLKDVYLPKQVIDTLNTTLESRKRGFGDKVMDVWKKGKTLWNPAYHTRNLISNQILSDMSTGRGIPATLMDYGNAVRAYKGKGDQTLVNAAREVGLIGRKDFGEMFSDTMDVAGMGKQSAKSVVGRVASLPGKLDDAAKGAQNFSEETAKLNVFTHWVKQLADKAGKTVAEAATDPDILKAAKDKAEEAIFSPYRIGKAERNLVGNMVPFYSFTRQALPFTAKTLVNNPERITKYAKAKTAVEGLSPEGTQYNKNLPNGMEQSIRLPGKRKDGAYSYLDPTYIYPFGNFNEGGGDTIKGSRLPFGLSINPFFSEGMQQLLNRDAYFGTDIAKSNIPEKSRAQRVDHAVRMAAPTLYTTIKGKIVPAVRGDKDYAGRLRDKTQTALDVAGIKTATYFPQEQAKWDMLDKKKKIQSIQKERRNIMADPRLSAQEKKKQVGRLDEILRETLAK